jgi:glycerol-3-phosphate acyltransferase PlsY
MLTVILIISSYLFGSIPFAWIFARAKGVDLRKVGSGNIGATNLSRALGRKWAYLCFALDTLKGFLPIFLASRFLPPSENLNTFWCLAVGIAAILGHIFPVYLNFKGGKGVATSFGVALGFWPYYTISAVISFAVWLTIVLIFRYISLASMIASIIFPVALSLAILLKSDWQLSALWPLLIVAYTIPVLVIFLHRQNINRILAGTEPKILQNTKV